MSSRDRRTGGADQLDDVLKSALRAEVQAQQPSARARESLLKRAAQQARAAHAPTYWNAEPFGAWGDWTPRAVNESPLMVLMLHAQLLALRGVQ